MSPYQQLWFPLFRRFDPEVTHDQTIRALALAQKHSVGRAILRRIAGRVPSRPVDLFGLQFANELGVAAGFDKNAVVIEGLGCLGFGHVEVGTLTPKPQQGNPKPRVFRLIEDRAIINRMGFPNRGVADALTRMKRDRGWGGVVVGVSLGKQKETVLDDAAKDYLAVMDQVYPFADYLAVNVSSPNTPGLRKLQGRAYLEQLLMVLVAANESMATRYHTSKRPLLLKISPDVTWQELDNILEASEKEGASGLIACNTTLSRAGLQSLQGDETGGLSGRPLNRRSIEVVNYIWRHCHDDLPIVGVGGIMSADDVYKMLDAGARLVQLYTGLVYGGPGIAGRILRMLESS